MCEHVFFLAVGGLVVGMAMKHGDVHVLGHVAFLLNYVKWCCLNLLWMNHCVEFLLDWLE